MVLGSFLLFAIFLKSGCYTTRDHSAMVQSVYTEEPIMATISTHIDTAIPTVPDHIGGVNVARLYRAIVGCTDYSDTEQVAFVEASSHQTAIDKIAAAVAAIEHRTPADVINRIYNCSSARELIASGESDDLHLRILEMGWIGGRPIFLREPLEPLFLLNAPAAFIRMWAAIPHATQPGKGLILKTHLAQCVRTLDLVLKQLGAHASVRHAWILLQVASAGPQGLDQRELVRAIGTAATSRIAQALGVLSRRGHETGKRVPGAGLIESHQDPDDRRLRRLTLTPAGRRLINRIDEAAA